jgi:transcriptional regulator with XRE-family HTH domain
VLGFTQEELASRLGVQQAAVSRLERRSDITLSSLRRYVEALGGQLEINVRTADGEQLRLLDPGQRVKARAACTHVTKTLFKSLFAHSGDASSRTLNPRYSNAFYARLATRSLRAPAHSRGTSPLWECAAARPCHRGPHRRLCQRRATGSRLAKRRPLAAWP